jgi:hypothetical protein
LRFVGVHRDQDFLVNEDSDEILQFLVRRNLLNRPEDKVIQIRKAVILTGRHHRSMHRDDRDAARGVGHCR